MVDLVVLYTRCGNEWLIHMAQADLSKELMVYSESICKVYPFFFNFLFHLSRWLIVAASIEGFISIKYPEKRETLCTVERARAVILLQTVLLVCANIHFFWSYELVNMEETFIQGKVCTFAKYGHQSSEEFQNIIWPMFDLVISDILPYIIVITSSIVMFVQIVRGKHRGTRAYQEWEEKYTLDSNAITQSKVMLLIMGIYFVIQTLPKFCHGIFRYLLDSGILTYTSKLDAQSDLAGAIVSALEYFFFSGKFLVYLCSIRRFRMEVVTLFRFLPACRRLRFRLQKSNSSTNPLIAEQSSLSVNNYSDHNQLTPMDISASLITSL